jgi:hypothetical protein
VICGCRQIGRVAFVGGKVMRGILRSVVAVLVAASACSTTATISHPAKAAMTCKKLLTAAVIATLALSACTSTVKQHHIGVDVKKHLRGAQPIPLNPYKVDWRACVVSVIPIPGKAGEAKDGYDDANYIINFPNTLKKLQFINVYESPRDLYIALESFPGVPTECLPPPSTVPTTYPTPGNPNQAGPQPSTSPPTTPPTSPVIGPSSPPPTTPSVSSAQCVLLEPDQTYCRSSDPTVILEGENIGDTSDCTFSDQISWGDGSPQQTVVYQGADNVPEVVASHTYEQLGAYGITANVTVVDGPCTAIDGEYTFAYVTG